MNHVNDYAPLPIFSNKTNHKFQMRMKKSLLSVIVLTAVSSSAFADQCYTYKDADGFEITGAARRVSENGRWVVGGDDLDETGSFIIDTTDPSKYVFTPDGLLLDINDDGVAVGAKYRVEGYAKFKLGAIYKNGEWTLLPVPEVAISDQSYAVGISDDSKIIGGYAMCENSAPDEPGKQFPVIWKLNEASGEYEVARVFNELDLPGTYGFQVSDMSPDGKWLVGYMGLDMGDNIGVILNTETGELKKFHEIEYKTIEFEVTDPITGEPAIMVSDNIMCVDGNIDGYDPNVQFRGMFVSCNNRYVFGSIDEVYNLNEKGEGKIRTYATVYDLVEDKFYNGSTSYAYLSGVDNTLQFTTSGEYVYGGRAYNVSDDFETGITRIAGIYDVDASTNVLVGSYIYDTPLGDMLESPIVLILDKPLVSVEEIGIDPTFTSKVTVENGTITVEGAENVAIFAINGSTVTLGNTATVVPGVYIVVADGHSAKVIVE